ncbi:MAG: hypothetical protein ACR2PI_26205 [Hyphomicrobiaceae bacterium]
MSTLTKNQPTPRTDTQNERPKVGDIRRMGPYGPVYEVTAIESSEAITIQELESERITHNYPVADFKIDLVE